MKKENGCCQEKKDERGPAIASGVTGVNQTSEYFDTTAAIAKLSLTVIDLQKAIGGIQGALQQFGMNLSQLGDAHNQLANMVESLAKGETKTETSGKPVEASPIC